MRPLEKPVNTSEDRSRDEDPPKYQVDEASRCARPGMESLRQRVEARREKSDYSALLQAFERANGPIVNSYFSTSGVSGVVITRVTSMFYWREERRVPTDFGHRHLAPGDRRGRRCRLEPGLDGSEY